MVKKSETLSSSSIVLTYIKEKIANNEWSKGDKIYTEPQFMDILGVSRAAVRKAINQLVDSNILIKIQGNGTFISENSSTSLFNPLISHFLFDEYDALSVLEFRKLIEPSCVSLFIDLLSDEKIHQLKSCIKSMEESELTNNEEFYKADFNFHNIIVKGTQNALASKIMDLLHESLINYQYKSNKAIGPKTGLKEHKQILYAIESKDKELASLLMKRHIERSEIDMKNYIKNNTVLKKATNDKK
ncbi:MAG: FadR/GntR family transcriptional regulator [Pleomorphochaeta sp.]